jgi:hypothetical protein
MEVDKLEFSLGAQSYLPLDEVLQVVQFVFVFSFNRFFASFSFSFFSSSSFCC